MPIDRYAPGQESGWEFYLPQHWGIPLTFRSGFLIAPDFRGYTLLSSFQPLNIEGLDWYLMAEIDELELQDKWKRRDILKLHE